MAQILAVVSGKWIYGFDMLTFLILSDHLIAKEVVDNAAESMEACMHATPLLRNGHAILTDFVSHLFFSEMAEKMPIPAPGPMLKPCPDLA